MRDRAYKQGRTASMGLRTSDVHGTYRMINGKDTIDPSEGVEKRPDRMTINLIHQSKHIVELYMAMGVTTELEGGVGAPGMMGGSSSLLVKVWTKPVFLGDPYPLVGDVPVLILEHRETIDVLQKMGFADQHGHISLGEPKLRIVTQSGNSYEWFLDRQYEPKKKI